MATSFAGRVRSAKYYIEDGDLVVQVANTLFRLHKYHLLRSTTFFNDMFEPQNGTDDNPLVLEGVKTKDFEALLWFFYESAYDWLGSPVDTEAIARWKNILTLAGTFHMGSLCRAASQALHHLGSLDDIVRVVLDATPGMLCSQSWLDAPEAVRRIIGRSDALSDAEARSIGMGAAMAIFRAREEAWHQRSCHSPRCSRCQREAICYHGVHFCDPPTSGFHYADCPERGRRVSRDVLLNVVMKVTPLYTAKQYTRFAPYPSNVDGDVYFRVAGLTYALHSYHLTRNSPVFRAMFSLPTTSTTQEGLAEERPIVLPDNEGANFMCLLWFFYDYPYEWSFYIEESKISQWVSILEIADKYDMQQICKVALSSLGRANALSDIHKLALCRRHNVDEGWAFDAFQRLCSREAPLALDEMNELGTVTTAKLVAAREALLRTALRKYTWKEEEIRSVANQHYFKKE